MLHNDKADENQDKFVTSLDTWLKLPRVSNENCIVLPSSS